jgi:predicted AlkP superfamily pyrophosphatase or phosphodiesterase
MWSKNNTYETNTIVDGFIEEKKIVVVLLIDWLWYNYILQNPQSFLYKHLQWSVYSTFPSTTAVAHTWRNTWLASNQHQLTSWYFYETKIWTQILPIPFQARLWNVSLEKLWIDYSIITKSKSIFESAKCDTIVVNNSSFTWWYSSFLFWKAAKKLWYSHVEGYFSSISKWIESSNWDRTYLYAYWDWFDSISHQYWNQSRETLDHFNYIDKSIESVCLRYNKNNNIWFIVSSDHWFMDATVNKTIAHNEKLDQYLITSPFWEARYVYFLCKPWCEDLFLDELEIQIAWKWTLYKSEELLKNWIFWLWENKVDRYRYGTYTLILDDDWIYKYTYFWNNPSSKIWHHWWISENEMLCPLILI